MSDGRNPGKERLRPLAELTDARLAEVRAVLTDIDDTLTSEGRLPAAAYDALERLHDAGFLVVPVTGRPAGWCDMIARFWPVDAVVGENGAFTYRYLHDEKRMLRSFRQSDEERAANRKKLEAIRDRVLVEVPGSGVAADQFCRDTDLAIDFREDVPPLPRDAVRRIVEIFEAHGAVAKVSSIHVNGWFGAHDKVTTCFAAMQELFGIAPEELRRVAVFAGDSPNDCPMFAELPLTVGVANVLDFEGDLDPAPAYVTPSRSAAGFVELAERLLVSRRT
jgi:HAD superfamily hydrolase (TIGR01484 family)